MADEIITRGVNTPAQVRRIERGWTAKRRKAFLDVLAASANVRLAADAAGAHPSSAYQLRQRDAAFAGLWAEAMALGYETIEQALIERARGGANAVEIDGRTLTLTGRAAVGETCSPPPARIVDGRVEMDVKLAMWLLERQDKRGARAMAGNAMLGPAPSRAAVEAKIARKLDALAKRPKR